MPASCRLRQHDYIPMHGGEDRFQGEGGGQDEVEFRFQFADFGSYLEQAEPDGIELSGSEVGARERLLPEGVQDDIGGAVEHEADIVCGEAVTGGSAAFKCDFMVFDEVFHAAPIAIGSFIDKRGP